MGCSHALTDGIATTHRPQGEAPLIGITDLDKDDLDEETVQETAGVEKAEYTEERERLQIASAISQHIKK